ncbi:MAG: hypothetical protein RL113_1409, partial [Pseudomonadota bacterium]
MKPFLLFPHQLFQDISKLKSHKVYLFEAPLFFTQYRFHIQKLIFHRASMKFYEAYLLSHGLEVEYVEVESYGVTMDGFTEAFCYDVADFELFQDLKKRLTRLTVLPSPNFIYSPNNALFMHHFYIDQRKRLDILMDHGKPLGGKWSYDSDNRKKISKNIALPKWQTFENE